ncbi:MAG: EamA family transporter [Abditibacteriota bacterium]|nr:EamA family transporter [Abditibacteriota bacterium]
MKTVFYLIVAVIAFTTFEPVSKLITDTVSPVAITGIRFLLGGLMLYPLAFGFLKKQNLKIQAKDYFIMGGLGILCICISMLSLQQAVKLAPSPAVIAIVFSVNSVITITLGSLVLKEKLTLYKILAIILCIIGICFMFDPQGGANVMSIAYALIAAVSFSLYTVFSKKMNEKYSASINSAVGFTIGGLILFVYSYIGGCGLTDLSLIDTKVIFVLLYLIIVVTGIGYIAYFKAFEEGGAVAAGLVFFIKPILTPFVTWIVNGIVPDYKVFIALALIIIGSYLGLKKQ